MKRVAIYARVSSADQAQADKLSIPDQLRLCRRAAIEAGCTLGEIDEYKDAGISGGGEKHRPHFNRLMDDVRAGRLSAVYFHALDRFSRNTIETLMALQDMDKANVKFISLGDPALEDPLIRTIIAGMAQAERARIKERTLPRKLAKRDSGYWVVGAAPYGYRLNRNTKTLIQCPNEAPVVRRIFDLAGQGLGRIQIARVLNSERISGPEVKALTREGRKRRIRVGHTIDHMALLPALEALDLKPLQSNSGGMVWPEWSSTTVSKILGNTMAFGQGGKVRFIIEPGGIIGEDEFVRIQHAMKARRVSPDPTTFRRWFSARWLLTGFLRCGTCGANYVHHESKGSHRYCCGRRRAGTTCRSPNTPQPLADKLVLAEVRRALWQSFPTAEKFREYLMLQAMGRLSDLKDQMHKCSIRADEAKAAKERLEQIWRTGLEHGLPPGAMSATAAELVAATSQYQRFSSEDAILLRKASDISAGLIAQESEIKEVAERMRQALVLATSDGDEHGNGNEQTINVRAVLSILLKSATVTSAGELVTELHDHARAMPEIIQLLAGTELDFQRKMRFAASA